MPRSLIPALIILLTAAVIPASAQRGPTYCNVTEIKSEQLSNGVRITIVTDGTPEWDLDFERLVREGAMRLVHMEWGDNMWPTERFNHIPVRIWNAKSKLGSGFVPVGKYPISHVTIAIPEWAHEGVGLELDIAAYLGFTTGEGELQQWRSDFLNTQVSEDRSSIMLVWGANRFPPCPPPATPKDLPPELSVTTDGGLLTIRAVNAEMRAVASAISRATGLPITAPADSDLRVSACLDRVTPEAALEAVAVGCGLCAQECADAGWIVAQPRAAGGGYAVSCSRVIPLRYLRAADAMDLLPNFLLDYLRADEEANAIIVNGPFWLVDRVAQDLAKLDTRPSEVTLEVVTVECSSSQLVLRQLDLTRHLSDFAFAVDTLAGGLEVLWLEGLPRGWEMLLENRESRGTVRLQSRATLRIASGRTARVFAGQQRHIIVERIEDGITAEVEPVDIGTELDVQPRLGAGDEIVFHLDLHIRNLRGSDSATGLPVVGLRQAEQTVRARDGETIAIAGLRSDEAERRENRIPVLGSLPVIGQLFRSLSRERAMAELVVFITPHIIRTETVARGDQYG